MSLGKQAIQGAAWNYAAFLASKGILVVVTLLLARLLSPAEFGLVGMALLVITAFDILRDFGIGAALIQRQREVQAAANLAFLLTGSIGVILFVVNWLLAPFTAQFFQTNDPQQTELLVGLIRVLGLSLLFVSLGSVQDSLLQKELNYRRRMLPEVGRTLSKGLLSVTLALAGWGVWSLVLGQVLGDACATVLLWLVSRWRPSSPFPLNRELLRSIANYGSQIMLVGALGWVIADVDYLIIGRLLGEVALGVYTLAFRIPELIIRNLSQSVSAVAFPVAARLQDDRAALRDAYLRMQHYMLLVLAPLGFGLCAIAPSLVHILFQDKWNAAIPVMQVLSVYIVLGGISHWPGVVYKAVGRPDIMSRLGVLKLAMLAPTLWWAAINYGVLGVAWGQLLVMIVVVLIEMSVAGRFVDVRVAANLRIIAPPFTCAVVMALAVRCVSLLDASESSVGVLMLAITVGSLVYLSSIWLLDRQTVSAIVSLGRSSLRKGRTVVATPE
jgi:O-antigen/teichoic acid export membrane protein